MKKMGRVKCGVLSVFSVVSWFFGMLFSQGYEFPFVILVVKSYLPLTL